MNRTAWSKSIFLAGFTLASVCATGWGQTASDVSLADVARRRPEKKAVMVVDDDALRRYKAAHGIPDTPAAAPASGTADGNVAAGAKPADRPSGKKLTVNGLLENGTVEQARQMLNALKKDREKLLARYEQLRVKLASENNEFLRRLYTNSLSNRGPTLSAKDQQIDALEKAIQSAEAKQKGNENSAIHN